MISAHPLYDHFHQHLSESAMQMYGEIGNLKLGIIQFKSRKLRIEASEWVLIYSPLARRCSVISLEKCGNYSAVRKDKAANQPQIIEKKGREMLPFM